jgi:hypothetical protein
VWSKERTLREKELRRSTKLSTVVVALCAGACKSGGQQEPTTTGEIDYQITASIGDDLANDNASFGQVSGLSMDRSGRIYVADVLSHHVKVFSPEGKFLFAIGRKGAGPGEMDSPCCIAFDPRGELWVRDNGNSRYSAYTVGDTNAVFVRQIRMAHSDANLFADVTFDAEGRVIDIGSRTDAQGNHARHRFTLLPDGAVAADITIPNVPQESTGIKLIDRPIPNGKVTFYAYPPYGPLQMVAHAPNGEWAHGLNSRYVIDWRQSDGSLIRTVTGDVMEGPLVSAEERSRAEQNLLNDRKRFGTDPGYSVPARKQPLRRIFFDASGRLWVQLSVAEKTPQRAHIYDRNGARVGEAVWPVEADITHGVMRGDTVWGVATDSLGVNTIVRLTPIPRRYGINAGRPALPQ